jgi:hypothetical protein
MVAYRDHLAVCLFECVSPPPPKFLKAGIVEPEETATVGRVVLYAVRVVSKERGD